MQRISDSTDKMDPMKFRQFINFLHCISINVNKNTYINICEMWYEWKRDCWLICNCHCAWFVLSSPSALSLPVSFFTLYAFFFLLVYHDVCFSNKFPSWIEMKPGRNEAKLINFPDGVWTHQENQCVRHST